MIDGSRSPGEGSPSPTRRTEPARPASRVAPHSTVATRPHRTLDGSDSGRASAKKPPSVPLRGRRRTRRPVTASPRPESACAVVAGHRQRRARGHTAPARGTRSRPAGRCRRDSTPTRRTTLTPRRERRPRPPPARNRRRPGPPPARNRRRSRPSGAGSGHIQGGKA